MQSVAVGILDEVVGSLVEIGVVVRLGVEDDGVCVDKIEEVGLFKIVNTYGKFRAFDYFPESNRLYHGYNRYH